MNRNTLGKKFNRLAVITGILPLIVGVYLLFYSQGASGLGRSALPALAYVLFLCCLLTMAYIFNFKEKDFAVQIEQLRKDAQKRTDELNVLRELSDLTKDAMPTEDLLRLILDKAMEVVAVRNGSVFLVDPSEPEGLRLFAARPPMVFKNDEAGRPRRCSFVKSVIESGKVLRIQDIESDPRTRKANDPRYGAPSFISMPVYKNKQVIAVMNLANKESGGIFTESDERILTIMLAEIGAGIETLSLHHKIKQQQADIKILQEKLKKEVGKNY
jgi:K+-sensing histidine kinase KdpD